MNVLDHIRKAIEGRRAAEVIKTGEGGAQDWPDYNRRKGVVQGLDKALGAIADTKRELQRTGDLDSEA